MGRTRSSTGSSAAFQLGRRRVGGVRAGSRWRLDHLGRAAEWTPSRLSNLSHPRWRASASEHGPYTDVDPTYGGLSDFDELTAGAASAARVCSRPSCIPTSTSGSRAPDWCIWAKQQTSWISAFRGSAWAPRRRFSCTGYPRAAGLSIGATHVPCRPCSGCALGRAKTGTGIRHRPTHPGVRATTTGHKLSALPLSPRERLALSHSRNAPDTGERSRAVREAAGDDLLVGEVYLRARAGSLGTENFGRQCTASGSSSS